MLFSLIVPTIQRTQELSVLLGSIAGQKTADFGLDQIETIIVDQNPDDRLLAVIEPYRQNLNIVHLKAPPLGQSHAKNLGMRILRGKYVAFPDDDCFYETSTLEGVHRFFGGTQDKFALFGRSMEKASGRFLLNYPKAEKLISRPKDPSVFLGLQIAQFYTASMVKAVGDFDVDLCSGGKWGSGEETDFAIRCLRQGFSFFFKPEILVYHPLVTSDTMELPKIKKYSVGFGALCRKQGLFSLWAVKTLKQMLGAIVFFLMLKFQKARVHWTVAKGRWTGFWGYGAWKNPGRTS